MVATVPKKMLYDLSRNLLWEQTSDNVSDVHHDDYEIIDDDE